MILPGLQGVTSLFPFSLALYLKTSVTCRGLGGNRLEPPCIHLTETGLFTHPTRRLTFLISILLGDSVSKLKNKNMEIKLFDRVIHPEIYNGNEVFVVVGIRVDELELQGDWSGGTHNVSQRGWFKREGIKLKQSC